jgi:hypothetical protein
MLGIRALLGATLLSILLICVSAGYIVRYIHSQHYNSLHYSTHAVRHFIKLGLLSSDSPLSDAPDQLAHHKLKLQPCVCFPLALFEGQLSSHSRYQNTRHVRCYHHFQPLSTFGNTETRRSWSQESI